MKPTLENKPNDQAYQDLLRQFADGTPLSCDQLNFLAGHEKVLSNPKLDPVLKYYLKHYKNHTDDHSFLLPHEKLTKDDVARFKKRLKMLLSDENPHIALNIKPEVFLQFRALTMNELIYLHGNQLLTGAPFIEGGIPQLIYFQWGNLFGIAKYVILAEEHALNGNILMYFEDRHERSLNECVMQYNKHLNEALQLAPQPEPTEQPALKYHSPFSIPKLTLDPVKENREEE